MKPSVVTNLKEYERLMLQKRGIENELEMLKEEIIPEMPTDQPVETPDGVFTISSRPKWEYSTEVQMRDRTLAADKKLEEQVGTAKMVPGKPFLVYRSNWSDKL